MPETILIETDKTVLSGESRIYKTGLFIAGTKNFRDADLFFSKLAEGVISESVKVNREYARTTAKEGMLKCFKLETTDGEHTLFFALGSDTGLNTAVPRDIIFFKYSGRDSFVRRNDIRLSAYLRAQTFQVQLSCINIRQSSTDFQKLYTLSHSQSVHFPLLNGEQKSLVAIEDQNVLVQGVAGSGKTNVCIDKILFSACRAYAGRILYSTFSRGLLIDTQNKVKQFRHNLSDFAARWERGGIVFADGNHKKAVENKLGIEFPVDGDDKILQKIRQIIDFLDNKVDYFLIEDLYAQYVPGKSSNKQSLADENYFVKKYIKNLKNHQLRSRLEKINYLSYEVIYKEIYGVIFGCYDLNKPAPMLSFWDYSELRKDSFSKPECENIYALAKDYAAHLNENNLADNNLMSRQLLGKSTSIPKYSLAILDEVQDLTQVSLCLMKSISRKMFCVGDALQMINPSFFSFAYLKRLLFEKDIVSVAELSHNYRSTGLIAGLIDKLGGINVRQFGTHSFVLKCSAVMSDVPTSAVYVNGKDFLNTVNDSRFNNYTVIVSSYEEKEKLRAGMQQQEILTVAEIKGLERETVVLYNVLSANYSKWKALERISVNRKRADENSVFRYYFNLFYVAVSRGKSHVYIAEDNGLALFDGFFKENFEALSVSEAAARIALTSDKADAEQDELLERIDEFLRLEQFDNARFTANKILNDAEKAAQLEKVEIFESLVYHGKHREAGIRFWEAGMHVEARGQFILSGDDTLVNLLDAAASGDHKNLDIGIVRYLPEVSGNEPARKLIMQVIQSDLNNLKETQKTIDAGFKSINGGK